MSGARFGLLLLKDIRPDLDRFLEQYHRLMAVVGVSPGLPTVPSPGPGRGRTVYPYEIVDGRIKVQAGLAPPRLSAAIMAFWPEENWGDAAMVSYGESSWKYNAVNDTRWRGGGECGVRYWYSDEVGWATTEYSVGYFQINICAHGFNQDYWEQPDHNVAKAVRLYHESGWSPWTVTARRLGLM